MIGRITRHLGLKIFILLASVIVLSVVPLTYTALRAIGSYGDEMAGLHEMQLRTNSYLYLKEFTQEQAGRYHEFFARISASAGLLASQAGTIYSDIAFFSGHPLADYHFERLASNGQWANTPSDAVVSVYWGSDEISDAVRSELRALTHMNTLFNRVLTENPEVLASHMITATGIGQYCTENVLSKKMVFDLPPTSTFDLRDGEPFTIFSKDKGQSRDVRWTNVYKDDVIDGLMMTASAPIYDDKQVFRGIAGIDVPIATIVNKVLNYGKRQRSVPILFSFILDRNSRVVALSDDYFEYFGLQLDRSRFLHSDDVLKASLHESTNPDIRELAQALETRPSIFQEFTYAGGKYFLASSRMAGPGWVLGVVVREVDLLDTVEQNRMALRSTIREMKINGVLLSLLTIGVASLIVYLALRYLVTPLRTLALATRRVAEGDLAVRCPVSTQDELGTLAASFNSMVEQLRIARAQQEQYAAGLEREVEAQTQQLVHKKNELESTVDLLKREAERRQIIAEALRDSQQQYVDTMEASRYGIFIVTDRVLSYANTAAAELFQVSQEELIGTDPLLLVHPEDRRVVAENMATRLGGGDVAPYSVRCRRKDGSVFFGEVWARVTTWRGTAVMVGTMSDVSDRKHSEERLRQQDRQLQKSLDEKEVLLKEIYHRTKNNMLVIISLMNLQSMDIDDERIKAVFREMENRIRAMALVHEKLYQSQDLSEIELGSYVTEICQSLMETMTADRRIDLKISIDEPTPINIDYAIPVGLVINEIVTNSIKHAFPDNRPGCISIHLEKGKEKGFMLRIGDNGIGLPNGHAAGNNSSFGMQIIDNLVRVQLGGSIDVDRGQGTTYLINIPEFGRKIRI